MTSIDMSRLAATAARRRPEFVGAAPFPHIVLDDFLDREAAEALLAEFTLPMRWTFLHHVNEKKLSCNDLGTMGPASRAVIADLQSPDFVDALETLTGIDRLRA